MESNCDFGPDLHFDLDLSRDLNLDYQRYLDVDLGSGGDPESSLDFDYILNIFNEDVEAESHSNPGLSPTLLNDDFWKNFETTDEFSFDKMLNDLLKDVSNVTWMSPIYTELMTEDAEKIKNNECMGAEHSTSEKHDRSNERTENLLPLKNQFIKQEEPKLVTYPSIPEGNEVCIRRNAVEAPDFEEEADVKTVYGDVKKKSSLTNSSRGGVLRTKPSFSDRQQLQLSTEKRQSSVSPRFSLGDRSPKQKATACKRKTNKKNKKQNKGTQTKKTFEEKVQETKDEPRPTGRKNKRSAEFDGFNDYVTNSTKKIEYQYQCNFTEPKSNNPENRKMSEKKAICQARVKQWRIDLKKGFEEFSFRYCGNILKNKVFMELTNV